MDKQERNVVHLELNGQHYYYGNIKALTDNWDRDTLGVSYNYLKNYGLSESHPYNGKKCIIRKGTDYVTAQKITFRIFLRTKSLSLLHQVIL